MTTTPESMAEMIGEFARSGLVNIVGGCCGTTPGAYQGVFGEAIAGVTAARHSGKAPLSATVGARAVHAHAGDQFRQYRRAHQHHGLGEIPQADRRERLRRRARRRAQPGRERRPDHRRQHGRRPDRFRSGDAPLPVADRRRARHRARAGDDRFLQMERDRGGAQVLQGKAHRQFHQPEGRRRGVRRACAARCAATAPPSS